MVDVYNKFGQANWFVRGLGGDPLKMENYLCTQLGCLLFSGYNPTAEIKSTEVYIVNQAVLEINAKTESVQLFVKVD